MESTGRVSFFILLLLCSYHHQASSVPASTAIFPDEALPTKSGYLPVNPSTGSAIYYTYYEAQSSTSPLTQTPLLIWLQGGPGCSSMIGNFLELGPWRVTSSKSQNVEHITLEANPGAWNRIYGLLFLDNPIGTGFSIAPKPEEIPTDQHVVAKHLFVAITGFIKSDPVFQNRSIYITGESYAGKYVPAIGYYILKKNMRLPELEQVNLTRVAIGDGLTDPMIQVELEKDQSEAVKLVKMGSAATDARNRLLDLLQNMTGLVTLFDFTKKAPYNTALVTSYVVGAALHKDVMKSVKYMVEFLVKKSKVLLYQGLFDLRDGVVSTEAWVKTLTWEGIGSFLKAEREVWKVNGELAGYVQK
ncbi:serine carboxypeptidase S10 family protein [Tripterygium wilfordii]|uniref:Carboxypeptidase n=1 Tax=Tripterygium wilfordii TaxID=458696 RepID=A0A7J7DZP6_TRIWF|nr:serine carboxypeptidase S10 family protein [Tripterygium wilfordii]